MIAQGLEIEGFAAAVIDALSSNICVTDKGGVIIAVNQAWRNFTVENPPISDHAGVGSNYLAICRGSAGPGSEGADTFASGLQAVLEKKSNFFEMEYPCHSPSQNRWFLGRVTRMEAEPWGAVISHANITDRKVLELELVKLATTDPLTGLPNRRYFLEVANLEAVRVLRFGAVASVLMVDLDHFKSVNDTYGHGVGDETLRQITQLLAKHLRQIDVLARVGGEEFTIMLPGTNEAGGVTLAQKLRQKLSETPVKVGNNQFNVTASFGVSEILAGETEVDACLDRADKALYAAKRSGRNNVISFTAISRAAGKSDALS
jgi:diguanylate cyclase (GGDEF)-like protein